MGVSLTHWSWKMGRGMGKSLPFTRRPESGFLGACLLSIYGPNKPSTARTRPVCPFQRQTKYQPQQICKPTCLQTHMPAIPPGPSYAQPKSCYRKIKLPKAPINVSAYWVSRHLRLHSIGGGNGMNSYNDDRGSICLSLGHGNKAPGLV